MYQILSPRHSSFHICCYCCYPLWGSFVATLSNTYAADVAHPSVHQHIMSQSLDLSILEWVTFCIWAYNQLGETEVDIKINDFFFREDILYSLTLKQYITRTQLSEAKTRHSLHQISSWGLFFPICATTLPLSLSFSKFRTRTWPLA